MTTPRRQRIARIIKLSLFSIIPAIVLLVLAEAAAIVSISRQGRVAVDERTGRSVYTMRVGLWPWSRRTVTPLNSLMLPDEEFPAADESKRCTHVVFAGDSYVFGDGVDRDSNFVEVVRRRLAGHDQPCVRLFNIGERGTTIDRQLRRILETMDRLKPDVVILAQYQNDLTDLRAPGAILGPAPVAQQPKLPGRVPVPRPALQLSTVKLLAYRSTAFMIQRRITRDELRHWSVLADSGRRGEAQRLQGAYATIFGQLAESLDRRGIAFGTVIIPSKLDLLAGRYPEEEYFVSVARQRSVPHLRIFPILDERRTPYAFLMYDGHLNEHGHRLVADAVLQWFAESPPPFPSLNRGAAATAHHPPRPAF